MNLIAAVDNNWAIGYKNKLLERIPEDMEFFKKMTTDKTVVMGRKTLESFPKQKPLPNRRNIVLTRNKKYAVDDVEVAHNLPELWQLLQTEKSKDIFCIGGDTIYHLLFPYCDTAYITKIYKSHKSADSWCPDLTQYASWYLQQQSSVRQYENLFYQFLIFKHNL